MKSNGKFELRRLKMSKKWLLLLLTMSLASVAWSQLGVDVTSPDDFVVGIPNDGNWPGSENPAMVINNDPGTKYLHFGVSLANPTVGFRVTPIRSKTIVGGMTFETANDSPERDPMTFELYGSNVSINGPYVLIASGSTYLDVGRYSMNTQPISFQPGGAFDHYQVLFPTLRDTATATMMQIAEVELLEGTLPVYLPNPQDQFGNYCIDGLKLTWQVNPSIVNPKFTVSFGTDPNAPKNPFVTNVTVKEVNPVTILGAPLQYNTTYYWSAQVIGDPNISPTWKFTTAPITPLVTREPDDVTSEPGGTVAFQFSAAVTCDPQQVINYQWFYEPDEVTPAVKLADGADKSGTATNTLVLQNLKDADIGLYFCVATGKDGFIQSRLASLQLLVLLGYWPLEGDCTDMSGNGNNGVARGDSFVFGPGIIGQAANFNNRGLFEIPNPAFFDQANKALTVYCWIKSNGTGDWEPFVAKNGESGGWQLRKRGSASVPTLTTRGTSGTDDPQPTAPNLFDGRWHQVVGTYDGANRRIYMDGSQIMALADTGTISNPTTNPLVPVSIGGRMTDAATPAPQNPFNGMVDDVRIYKGAMPAKLVAQLYANASGIEVCSPALPGDLSGPKGLPDCVVNLYDLAAFAGNWMKCQNIDVTRCP